MTHAPSITVATIVLDEARNLPGWLAATAWADERLIVDGGSRDDSVRLARRAGVRIVERSFDNFAAQRNSALQHATGDWVLFVDADERPTRSLVAELRRRLPDCRQDAFRVRIRSAIFGRPFRFSGTQDDRPLRLVRRGAGRWVGEVHEVLHVAGPKGELGWLEHTTIPDLSTMLAKIHRYTQLAAAARVARDRRPRRIGRPLAAAREVFRRLLWKQGWLDGPEGWAFCLLSGVSEWVLETQHRRLWRAAQTQAARHRA
jgi:glycosyltransferase involved in cell wall biosynthesis